MIKTKSVAVVNDPTRWAESFALGNFVNDHGRYHVAVVGEDDYGYWIAAMRPARAIYMGLALAYMGLMGLLFKR